MIITGNSCVRFSARTVTVTTQRLFYISYTKHVYVINMYSTCMRIFAMLQSIDGKATLLWRSSLTFRA